MLIIKIKQVALFKQWESFAVCGAPFFLKFILKIEDSFTFPYYLVFLVKI